MTPMSIIQKKHWILLRNCWNRLNIMN